MPAGAHLRSPGTVCHPGPVDRAWGALWHGDVVDAAPGLLGAELTANGVTVQLTEVEAYKGEHDPASHSFRGQTKRNAVMFGPPGHAYVYFIFGMYWCLNFVVGAPGEASAVLVRAGKVIKGLPRARERRGNPTNDHDLARGPGLFTIALGIDGTMNGANLLDRRGPISLTPPREPVAQVVAGPRVGVAAAHDVPWRFWIADEPSVSAYRRHVPRRRSNATGAAP
jgi:DNA-3-methyladenine glycosylase